MDVHSVDFRVDEPDKLDSRPEILFDFFFEFIGEVVWGNNLDCQIRWDRHESVLRQLLP